MVNVPNILTTARIGITPIVYYAGATGQKELFAVLFMLGGLTDCLDGFLARKLGMKSDWGSVLDTTADLLFYPSGLMLYFFEKSIFIEHWELIAAGLVIFFAGVFIGWRRKMLTIPHLISAKTFAIIAYLFVLFTLVSHYSETFFIVVIAAGLWASCEQFYVLTFKQPSHERKWVWQ